MTPEIQEDLSQDKLWSCQCGRAEEANVKGKAFGYPHEIWRAAKAEQTSAWSFIAREFRRIGTYEGNANDDDGETQAGAPSTGNTQGAINWKSVKAHVSRLQMRIAKAVREGRHHKAKALQWLLTHSYNAKLLQSDGSRQNQERTLRE